MQDTKAKSTQFYLLILLLMLTLNVIGCSNPTSAPIVAPTASYMRVEGNFFSDTLRNNYGPKEFIASGVTLSPCRIGIFNLPGYRIDGYVGEFAAAITIVLNSDGSLSGVQEHGRDRQWYDSKHSGALSYFDISEKKVEGIATADEDIYAPMNGTLNIHYAVVGW